MATSLDFSKLHVVRTHEDYDLIVSEIERLLDAEVAPGTGEADRLELLSVLVETYDREHYQLKTLGSPQSILQFMLDQKGITKKELIPFFGSKSRVSEFFGGKRKLSMRQIASLRKEFGIPADLLMDSDLESEHAQLPESVSKTALEGTATAAVSNLLEAVSTLVASQEAMTEKLSTQMALQTRAITQACSLLERISFAQSYVMEQYASVTNIVVRPNVGDVTVASEVHLVPPNFLGSHTEPSVRLNLSAKH